MIVLLRASFDLTDDPHDDRGVTIVVRGELDLFSAPALERHLRARLLGGRTAVTVDLASTSFLDSAGIGALVNVLRALQPVAGTLEVHCPDEQMQRIFALTGLTQRLTVTP